MVRLIMACFILCLFAGAARSEAPFDGILVTPAWLSEHLHDPGLVILHVANLREDYTRGHIPGARFLWPSWLARSTPERSFEMPPADSLAAVLERLGVSNNSRVVLCHVLGDFTAVARAYVTFDYLGMGDRTAILDGGFEAWNTAGKPVEKEIPGYEPGVFVPKVRESVLANLDDVRASYDQEHVRLVDGRSAQGFNATEGAGVFRGGHIKGAINIPFSAVTDSLNRYQSPEVLKAKFAKAGIEPGDRVITYCGVGRAACPVWVAAKILGYEVRLYDGSFEEWSRREDLPVEITPAK